jgi:ABC-type transporter Mla MlaB component
VRESVRVDGMQQTTGRVGNFPIDKGHVLTLGTQQVVGHGQNGNPLVTICEYIRAVSDTSYAIRFDATTATIKLVGACGVASVEQLRDVGDIAFAQTGVDTIVVNCAGLTACDLTVLSVFIAWQNRARKRSIALDFESVPAHMDDLLNASIRGIGRRPVQLTPPVALA